MFCCIAMYEFLCSVVDEIFSFYTFYIYACVFPFVYFSLTLVSTHISFHCLVSLQKVYSFSIGTLTTKFVFVFSTSFLLLSYSLHSLLCLVSCPLLFFRSLTSLLSSGRSCELCVLKFIRGVKLGPRS